MKLCILLAQRVFPIEYILVKWVFCCGFNRTYSTNKTSVCTITRTYSIEKYFLWLWGNPTLPTAHVSEPHRIRLLYLFSTIVVLVRLSGPCWTCMFVLQNRLDCYEVRTAHVLDFHPFASNHLVPDESQPGQNASHNRQCRLRNKYVEAIHEKMFVDFLRFYTISYFLNCF